MSRTFVEGSWEILNLIGCGEGKEVGARMRGSVESALGFVLSCGVILSVYYD